MDSAPSAEPVEVVAAESLERLSGVLREDGRQSFIERTLATAREQLGMEMAWVGRIEDGRQRFVQIDGDATAFAEGALPQEDLICHHVLAGTVPAVIPDTRAEPALEDLQIVRDGVIGSYVGVPIHFSDGSLYGTFCAASRDADPRRSEFDLRFVRVLARLVGDQLEREGLEAEQRRLAVEAAGVGALLAALEARDNYTGDHSNAVVALAGATARELGIGAEQVAEVEQVALLHDIGKVGIPDAILKKNGPLTDEEWLVMRTHPEIGERIIAAIDGLSHLAPAVRAEHERWDGNGYLDGLAGEQIPVASRIVLACDAYHAMTSDRPYRSAMPHAAAVEELRAGSGSQFCPTTVPALLRALDGPGGRA